MSNFLSEFIHHFGGETLGFAALPDKSSETSTRPQINYVTLYNPSWSPPNDESLQALSKQILFFVKPTDHSDGAEESFELEERLNTVGLIRGSSSLACEFGKSTQSVSIHINDGLILSVELEKDYFLSISVSGGRCEDSSKDIYGKQLEILLREWHTMFLLFHSSFSRARNMLGDSTFKSMLKQHWQSFMSTYNCGSETAFGPTNLCWPNRTNSLGFFRFLPEDSYKASSIKLEDTQKTMFAENVFGEGLNASAILVANLSKDIPKRRGVVFSDCHSSLDRSKTHKEMQKVFNLLEDLDSNGCLTSKNISPKIEKLYAGLTEKWQQEKEDFNGTETEPDVEDEADPDISMSAYAATMDALNPATITNKLIVSPINDTINGFKYLGSSVSEQITTVPRWFHPWAEPARSEPDVEDSSSEPDAPMGEFLIGLVGEEITRFLIRVQFETSEAEAETVEMSVVAFLQEETLVILAFESGMEELDRKSFYETVKSTLIENITQLSEASPTSMAMGNSIGSLKDSIGIDIRDGTAGTSLGEVDNGFFYIVYDVETKCYRSSLPTLPTFLRPHEPSLTGKKSLYKIIFHLHDRLIAHFICKSKDSVFGAKNVATESLHKFSSRKSGDWMFYLIRHEEKIIIIIKSSNSKPKARVPSERDESYLIKVADSLYGAANLGFLDSLGEDVRIWLGRLSEGNA